MTRTRLAPSPTGALHLGNARTFALTWLWARAHGAGLPLRIEDIDSPRKKLWAVDQALDDLTWLGIDWDDAPLIQSSRLPAHVAALERLLADGRIYACSCSRKDVEAAQSAPHAEDELTYPGTCRDRHATPEAAHDSVGRPVALRFRADAGPVTFDDGVRGSVTLDPSRAGGDFVVARWAPDTGFTPGYQLAVVVDDADDGIDLVIRGDDLLSSVPRQLLIQDALGLPHPSYVHLPLVVGEDGRRLAKRHGDTRLSTWRERGDGPERVQTWIAKISGFDPRAWADPEVSGFSWDAVPRERVVVTARDWS